MIKSIIQDRLDTYQVNHLEQEENALKEIAQEIILYSLSIAGLFEEALFQGGTSLRIIHKLPRFSEDMDFILRDKNARFDWQKYMNVIEEICKEYGIMPSISDRSKADNNIKKLFIKDDSFGQLINLHFKHHTQKKILIKLEIDVNPPAGSIAEIKYLDFPLDFSVATQDLASSFAGKSHALLCRKYVKGRDWYDFLWYVSKGIKPNLLFLSNAIDQIGPWQGKGINVTPSWYFEKLNKKIKAINWEQAKADVERFLNERESLQLKLWEESFFLSKLEKLKLYNQ